MDKKLAALRKARERAQRALVRAAIRCEQRLETLDAQIQDCKHALDKPFCFALEGELLASIALVKRTLAAIDMGDGRQIGRWFIAEVGREMYDSGCGGREAVCRVIEDRMIPPIYWQMLEQTRSEATTQKRHREVGLGIIADLKAELAACLRALRKEGT